MPQVPVLMTRAAFAAILTGHQTGHGIGCGTSFANLHFRAVELISTKDSHRYELPGENNIVNSTGIALFQLNFVI